MRLCLLLLTVLFVSGCTAEQVRQMQSEADHAWCLDIGIDRDDARYANCRAIAAQMRTQKQAAALSSDDGLGLMLLNQSQQKPAFGTTTCSQVGNFLNCSHY